MLFCCKVYHKFGCYRQMRVGTTYREKWAELSFLAGSAIRSDAKEKMNQEGTATANDEGFPLFCFSVPPRADAALSFHLRPPSSASISPGPNKIKISSFFIDYEPGAKCLLALDLSSIIEHKVS
jgi:hypothetical protein